MTSWLAGIDPIYLSSVALFPGYWLTELPRLRETLRRLKRIAERKLIRVFLGNV